MNSFFQNTVNSILLNPKKIFLIDGIGALISAFLLGFILVKFPSIFGIPKSTLYFLALMPVLCIGYDAFCYVQKDENLGFLLKGIACLNVLYCLLSIFSVIYHQKNITSFGWIYIFIEVTIIILLIILELKLASELTQKNKT